MFNTFGSVYSHVMHMDSTTGVHGITTVVSTCYLCWILTYREVYIVFTSPIAAFSTLFFEGTRGQGFWRVPLACMFIGHRSC